MKTCNKYEILNCFECIDTRLSFEHSIFKICTCMSFQTREMTLSVNQTPKTLSYPNTYSSLNTNLDALNLKIPTRRAATFTSVDPVPALRSSTQVPPVTFQFNDPTHLADLLNTPKYNQDHMHVGLLNHTDAINKITNHLDKLHVDNSNHKQLTHSVFENHTNALNHLINTTTDLSSGVLDHKNVIENQHHEMQQNRIIIEQQTKLINDLRRQCDHFHEGLMNHTDVLKSQVENFNNFNTKMSLYDNTINSHNQKLSNIDTNVDVLHDTSNRQKLQISEVSNNLKDVHTGMIHHTEVLNNFGSQINNQNQVMNQLKDSHQSLSNRLQLLESKVTSSHNADLAKQISEIKIAINANAELLDELLNDKNTSSTHAMDRMMSHAARN